jgi:C4-dicarboxylate transporter
MSKVLGMLLLVMVLSVMVVVATAQPAAAQAQTSTVASEYPNVSGLQPFAAETNYMSLAGYLKWTAFKDQQVWLSTAEAQHIVAGQKTESQ